MEGEGGGGVRCRGQDGDDVGGVKGAGMVLGEELLGVGESEELGGYTGGEGDGQGVRESMAMADVAPGGEGDVGGGGTVGEVAEVVGAGGADLGLGEDVGVKGGVRDNAEAPADATGTREARVTAYVRLSVISGVGAEGLDVGGGGEPGVGGAVNEGGGAGTGTEGCCRRRAWGWVAGAGTGALCCELVAVGR